MGMGMGIGQRVKRQRSEVRRGQMTDGRGQKEKHFEI
jgi:hypothetical protein